MGRHNEVPVEDTQRPVAPRKNTKRWCKGKVGREHKRALRASQKLSRTYTCGWSSSIWRNAFRQNGGNSFWDCYHEEYCTACGKIMRDPWQLGDTECPDYTEDQTQLSKLVTP